MNNINNTLKIFIINAIKIIILNDINDICEWHNQKFRNFVINNVINVTIFNDINDILNYLQNIFTK